MRATDGDDAVIRVDLEREAFYLRAPKLPPEAAIEVCAWTDDAFFAARGDPADDIPADDIECLQKGRGMADYEYASGNLVLRADAKNYLIGTRLRSYSSDQDQAFFASTQKFDEEKRRPLSAQRDPLYLIVYIDRNVNRMIESGEYEAVHLEF